MSVPPDEEVERGLAIEDGDEPLLQFQRRGQAVFGAALAAFHAVPLPGDPVAQVAVGQGFQKTAASAVVLRQLVIVDQGVETVAFAAVPDMPDERTMMDQLAVLFEEAVAQPVVEARAAGPREQLVEHAVVPGVAEGGGQQFEQPLAGGRLAPHRGNADDAVLVRPGSQPRATPRPFALLVGQFHTGILFCGPAIAEQARGGGLQYGEVSAELSLGSPLLCSVPDDRPAGVAVKDPLGGIVGVGTGEAVGVPFAGDSGPMFEVEGDLDQRRIGHVEFLIDAPHRLVVFGEEQKHQMAGI